LYYKSKMGLDKAIDLTRSPELLRRNALGAAELSMARRVGLRAVAPITKTAAVPAALVISLTQHVPLKQRALTLHMTVDAVASQMDDMAEEAIRFFDLGRAFGMTADEVAAYQDSFIVGESVSKLGVRTSNASVRRAVLSSFVEDVFERMGLDEGSDLYRKYFSNEGHRHLIDEAVGTEARRAFLPYNQVSMQVAVPSAKDLFRANTKYSLTRSALNIAMPNALEATLNRVWKPGVLLRLGFITRASGEEMLAYMARFGPRRYLGDQMLLGAAMRDVFDSTTFGT